MSTTSTVEFVDQTLRDGQQSWWGMRMRAYEAAEASGNEEGKKKADHDRRNTNTEPVELENQTFSEGFLQISKKN